MLKILYKCDKVINELSKFSDDILYLGPAIIDDRLELFEKKIGFELPVDLKYIMKKHNGFSLDGTEVFGIDKDLRGSSLDMVYDFEHTAAFEMPNEFLPFSPDGRGNHYCLDLSRATDNICPVVFWQHDHSYKSKGEVETCNPGFFSWIKEVMIDWTLEDHNFDGTEK